MKTEIYNVFAIVVAILFSIVLWFNWIGAQTFTIANGIDTAITWLVGVIILSLFANLLGYLSEWFKSALGMAETIDIFDMLGIIVTILFTTILWFVWLSDPIHFTIASVIETSILWIVVALIIQIGALLIDFIRTKFWDYLPKPAEAAQVVKSKLKK